MIEKISSNKQKKVLVCPLNWGLGHASRSAVVIKKLIEHGFEVIIGADKTPLAFLKSEFPELTFVVISSPEIKYQRKNLMVLQMLLSIPKILFGIIHEHLQLKKLIKEKNIEIVISDNRYGLWNSDVYSVFITHQLKIQMPSWLRIFQKIVNSINFRFINKFNVCWIPDLHGKLNLGGAMSHPTVLPDRYRYIGLISRFNSKIKAVKSYKVLAILSGPEPQRSVLEKILINEFKKNNSKVLMVCGKPNKEFDYTDGNIHYRNHVETNELSQLIIGTPTVISRSGYSSIMDYVQLGKSAILIPTPGQTEQLYLAKQLMTKEWFFSVQQSNFNLKESIEKSKDYFIPEISIHSQMLDDAIIELLRNHL